MCMYICMRVCMGECSCIRVCMFCLKIDMHAYNYNDILVYVNDYVCKMKVCCHASQLRL